MGLFDAGAAERDGLVVTECLGQQSAAVLGVLAALFGEHVEGVYLALNPNQFP